MKQLALVAMLATALAVSSSAMAQQNATDQNSQSSTQQTSNSQTVSTGPITVDTTRRDLLPAGTELAIRTNQNITAGPQDSGRTFSGEIAREIRDRNGNILIPKGAPAELSVVSTKDKLGMSEVALSLKAVTVNGHTYHVVSNEQAQAGANIGMNKRTGEMVGGGAVLGTLIGAVAGGGKGAAIGAAVGAAGGGAAQVLTRGKEVKVPAETILNFKLDQPIQLRR